MRAPPGNAPGRRQGPRRPRAQPVHRGVPRPPRRVERFKANARAIADEAEAAGIRLCIETDSNLLPTAEIGVRLLDEIGHDWIQINYDPGNVVYYVGARPEVDIRPVSDGMGTCT